MSSFRICLTVVCLQFALLSFSVAQTVSVSQPALWASKPDAAAFEKTVNDQSGRRPTVDRFHGGGEGAAHS